MAKDGLEQETQFLLNAGIISVGVAYFAIWKLAYSREDLLILFGRIVEFDITLRDLIVFVVCVYLFTLALIWRQTGHRELNILLRYCSSYRYTQNRPIINVMLVILTGLIIGIMALMSSNTHYFSNTYLMYQILDVFLWIRRRNEIRSGIDEFIDENSKDPNKIDREAIYHIEFYYFKRPHLKRVFCFIVYISIFCIIYDVSYFYQKLNHTPINAEKSNYIDICFYLTFLVAVSVQEYVVAQWRRQLDTEIKAIEKKRRTSSLPSLHATSETA